MNKTIKIRYPLIHRLLTAFTLSCFSLSAFSADINGIVVDSISGAPIENVLVRAIEGKKVVAYTSTNTSGVYNIKIEIPTSHITLSFQHISFESKSVHVDKDTRQIDVRLTLKMVQLREFSVKAAKVLVKTDTVSYNVASFTSASDRSFEEVIQKMPGIKVLDNGGIQYQGKNISQFSIEGLDALNGKYVLATRNLQAKDVNRVEMIENFQKKKMLRGKEQSEDVAMNLRLSNSAKSKLIVTHEIGVGVREKDLLYHGAMTGLIFTKRYQFVGALKTNNWGRPLAEEITNHYNIHYTTNAAYDLASNNLASSPPLSYNLYRQKNEVMTSLNTVIQLSGDKTVAINASYLRDRNRYHYQTVSTYYLNNSRTTITEDQTPDYATDYITARIDYSLNSSKKYVKNITSFEAKRIDNTFDLLYNSNDIRQSVKSNLTSLRNDAEIHTQIGKKRYRLISSLGYSQLPEKRLTFTGTDGQSGDFYQVLKGENVFTNNGTSLDYSIGKNSTLGVWLNILAKYDWIYTCLQRNDSSILNRNEGLFIDLFAKPNYRFDAPDKRYGFNASVSLHNFIMRYKNHILQDADYNQDIPLINTSFSSYYTFSAATKINLFGGINTNIGDFTNFIVNPIQVDYKQTSSQSGILAKNKTSSVGIKLIYQKPMTLFFSNGSVSYSLNNRNILNGKTLTGDSTNIGIGTLGIKDNNASNSLSLSGYVAKGINAKSTSFSLSSSYSMTQSNQLRQGIKMDVNGQFFSITPQIKNEIVKKVNLDYSMQYRVHRISGTNLSNTYHHQRHNLNVNYNPIVGWIAYGSLQYNRSEVSPGVYKTMNLVDASLRYTHKRFETELKINNLFNLKRYSQTILDHLDSYAYTYYMNPREAVIVFRFRM